MLPRLALILALCGWGGSARAQMFGPRDLSGTLAPRSGPGGGPNLNPTGLSPPRGGNSPNPSGPATVSGFSALAAAGQALLESRARDTFVGRDLTEAGRFVGAAGAEGVGDIRSALPSVIPAEPSDVNREPPLVSDPRRRPYPPRLRLAAELESTPAERVALMTRIQERLTASLGLPVRVTLEQRTAILEGQVATAHQRTLAELLARFEPGVSTIDNRLAVAESPDALRPAPAAPLPLPDRP